MCELNGGVAFCAFPPRNCPRSIHRATVSYILYGTEFVLIRPESDAWLLKRRGEQCAPSYPLEGCFNDGACCHDPSRFQSPPTLNAPCGFFEGSKLGFLKTSLNGRRMTVGFVGHSRSMLGGQVASERGRNKRHTQIRPVYQDGSM